MTSKKLLSPGARHLSALAGLALSVVAGVVHAGDARCGGPLQDDLCHGADLACPAVAEAGPAQSAWPMFQHDAQHTGRSPLVGPSCDNVAWTRRITPGRTLSQVALGAAPPGERGTVFVPVSKRPICALEPVAGEVLWCQTPDVGKLPDYSSPAVSGDGHIFIGTRDNDLWSIGIPAPGAAMASVAWRQKVCSDGDVTTPPTIRGDGVVYMGSDSLSAGSLFAMCPGPTRQVKWCRNPLREGIDGGGLKNVSPTLNSAETRLYVTFNGSFVAAFDSATGAELWRIRLDNFRNNIRSGNYTTVYDASQGAIYVGFDDGVWRLTEITDPGTGLPGVSASLLYETPAGEGLFAPPALDTSTGTLYFGASKRRNSRFYAVGTNGQLKWKKDVVKGRFHNLPPVVDAAGRVYFAISKRVYAVDGATGDTLWTKDVDLPIRGSPVIDDGRLYVSTIDANVWAIGDCPP